MSAKMCQFDFLWFAPGVVHAGLTARWKASGSDINNLTLSRTLLQFGRD